MKTEGRKRKRVGGEEEKNNAIRIKEEGGRGVGGEEKGE
jgi:hypothetical protein